MYNHGGVRPGAGRPRMSDLRRERVSVTLDPRLKDELERFAKTSGGGTISSAFEFVLKVGFATIKANQQNGN